MNTLSSCYFTCKQKFGGIHAKNMIHYMLKNKLQYIKMDALENQFKNLGVTTESKQITKGHGAGGSNTNKNGLPYEEMTDLKSEYNIQSSDKHSIMIKFFNYDKIFKMSKQSHLFKSMDKYVDKNTIKAHGCKNPDECYIDEEDMTMFILEKKFQQVGGSVCEKIQTPDFKIWQYSKQFPDFRIVYMYCLSDWFKENCKAELEYLEYKKIPVFWGNDPNYKQNIIDFIVNFSKSPQKIEDN